MNNVNDLSLLKALLNEKAIIEPNDRGLTLHESQNKDKEKDKGRYEVFISNVPDDTVAVKADCFLQPNTLLNCEENICKRADYIIVNQDAVIFLELKSGGGRNASHIHEQLKGAQCVMAYIVAIAKNFKDKPNFLNIDKLEQYFVSIHHKKSAQRTTTYEKKPIGKHNTPENKLKLKGSKFRYEKLIA